MASSSRSLKADLTPSHSKDSHTHHMVNWFDHTQRMIVASFPEAKPWGAKLVKRLATLLLSRLPGKTQKEILELLPKEAIQEHSLSLDGVNDIAENPSIGYADFIEQTASTLGIHGSGKHPPKITSEYDLFDHSKKIADYFLWIVALDFPAELKHKMAEALPPEIRFRMDLKSALMEDSKVA